MILLSIQHCFEVGFCFKRGGLDDRFHNTSDRLLKRPHSKSR